MNECVSDCVCVSVWLCDCVTLQTGNLKYYFNHIQWMTCSSLPQYSHFTATEFLQFHSRINIPSLPLQLPPNPNNQPTRLKVQYVIMLNT